MPHNARKSEHIKLTQKVDKYLSYHFSYMLFLLFRTFSFDKIIKLTSMRSSVRMCRFRLLCCSSVVWCSYGKRINVSPIRFYYFFSFFINASIIIIKRSAWKLKDDHEPSLARDDVHTIDRNIIHWNSLIKTNLTTHYSLLLLSLLLSPRELTQRLRFSQSHHKSEHKKIKILNK